MMMNPRMMKILEMMGQKPSDLMAAQTGMGGSAEYVTPDYMMPEMKQAAIAASPDIGYLDLPQDFGGTDNLAAIQSDLRNPMGMQMETDSVPPMASADLSSLPNFQNMGGMGLGNTAPQSFNTDNNSVRERLINQMLNMMGM